MPMVRGFVVGREVMGEMVNSFAFHADLVSAVTPLCILSLACMFLDFYNQRSHLRWMVSNSSCHDF